MLVSFIILLLTEALMSLLKISYVSKYLMRITLLYYVLERINLFMSYIYFSFINLCSTLYSIYNTIAGWQE